MTPETLEQLSELDARGFLAGADESTEEFLRRVEQIKSVQQEFADALADGKDVEIFPPFKVNSAAEIAPELLDEAAEKTFPRYGFALRHVRGFYLTRAIGWLWGGCMLGDPESGFSVFLLRNAFRTRKKFLNYRREELLAHELCHTARQWLNEPHLEEYFAYQISTSPLQRYLGNCFISAYDALLFVLPVMLLPAAEVIKAVWISDFPSWIFWLAAAVYPLFLLCRNAWSRRVVNRARTTVKAAGAVNVEAVLFRCTFDELQHFSAISGSAARQWMDEQTSPRWQVMMHRFF